MSSVEIVVPHELDRWRADKVLAVTLNVSRSVSRGIIDTGGATVGDSVIGPADKMQAGTVIVAELPEPAHDLVPDPDVSFDVVHEDDSLIVVDKPAGVVVHPGSGRGTGTLVHGLIARYPEIVGVGQKERWGIVHRLDKDTSGLLMVARTQETYESLILMLKAHDVSRRYIGVVQGVFTNTIGTIEAPIGRDPANPTRMHIDRSGRSARTNYRRLATWANHDATLLSIALETGRTHQIRVHMRSVGHPIVGDRVYGRHGVVGDPGRPWLHARQLAFAHPSTGEPMDLISSLPADLCDSLTSLGEPGGGPATDIQGELL